MNLTIVPYSDDQAAGVRDLIVPIQREEFGIEITYDDQPDLQDVAGFYRRGIGEFWVALQGDAVIGSIALVDIGKRQAALRKMFVRADHRGRRYGVAQRLLETFMEHASRHRAAEVFLGTTSAFWPRIAFTRSRDST